METTKDNSDHADTATVLELKTRLDVLWEQYLHFLDQYDQAQKQLGESMSSVCSSNLIT